MANGLLIRGDVSVMHKSWYRLLQKELDRRRKARRKHQKSTDEEDDSGLILPMELVEKILAQVPFPDVFKTRVLSRSWRRKFSLAYKRERPIHCPLLDELSTAAVRWPTFCPVYTSREGRLIGYNHTSLSWETIAISSYIPMKRIHSNLFAGREIGFGGSLMCIYETHVSFCGMGQYMFEILVANIQTGSWKTILCPLDLEISYDAQVRLICEPGSEDYKILVYDLDCPQDDEIIGIEFETHLFDSASSTWTSKQSQYAGVVAYISTYCTCSHQVHFNGNIYLMGPVYTQNPEDLSLHMIKYNLLKDVWAESSTAVQVKEHEKYEDGGVFFCGAKLMLVTLFKQFEPVLVVTDTGRLVDIREECRTPRQHSRRRPSGYTYRACAYEVCPETLEIDLVSVSPSGIFEGAWRRFMSDDNHIYFFCSNCLEYPSKPKVLIVRFNVSDASWDQLPSPPTDIDGFSSFAKSAYVPGQNPFALA